MLAVYILQHPNSYHLRLLEDLLLHSLLLPGQYHYLYYHHFLDLYLLSYIHLAVLLLQYMIPHQGYRIYIFHHFGLFGLLPRYHLYLLLCFRLHQATLLLPLQYLFHLHLGFRLRFYLPRHNHQGMQLLFHNNGLDLYLKHSFHLDLFLLR